MNDLSTKDLNKLRSLSKIIINRVEIFVETYLADASVNEELINQNLQEIIKAANNLITATSKIKPTENLHNINSSK
ncbi:hypothetical protein I8752_26915 [Nostocaceae cyanobacterium CENA369]|uniref:Uncharacterized protein n=1 Tax=Dendronalium phyllosphericum CENA369 TaxID=1725256 RepID=A0A8J7ILJ1_9NOST|nr:hypothetical protein [Dendronalium phyllosphericum]MBH8576557.1 hypothetical protein [Dendronalium phyllosphericum CENA369]